MTTSSACILDKVGGLKRARSTINVYGMYRAQFQPIVLASEAGVPDGSRLIDIERFTKIGNMHVQHRQPAVIATDT